MNSSKEKYTQFIKAEAKRLGFMACGISKAGFLEEEAPRLERWLSQNYHGQMGYMEEYFDKRLDPTLLVPDSKSVISLLVNYYPSEFQNPDTYKISKYAYGKDYHNVIKKKVVKILKSIKEKSARCTVGLLSIWHPLWTKLGRPKVVWVGLVKTAI